jgi:Holliday junction resolvase RusA-like endonuclease
MICFWQGNAVSANRRLEPGAGRWHASEEYKAFRDSLAWTLKAHFEHFAGPVSVRLFAVLGLRMDSDAIIKPCLDALELAGVLANDRQVRQLSIYREDRMKGETEDRIGFFISELKGENDECADRNG